LFPAILATWLLSVTVGVKTMKMVRPAHGRKTTIYDIAVAAHASPATVSLVLNDSWQRYRIKQETATRVLNCAEQLGYAVNLKARGLRLSRSGLAGMILPHYRNRFFAGLAEAFEAEARSRGLCPIVVSTHRHPGNELTVTETLLAQQVEFLFFTGVRDPNPLNELCRAAKVCCVNIDLPGSGAPSVVSDNRGGARQLTEVVLKKLGAHGADTTDIFFFGGVADDDATRSRVLGFKDALAANGISVRPEAIDCCGYQPSHAAQSLAGKYAQLKRLPSGLFMNGVTALEGALRFTSTLPLSELQSIVVGSFDWDPFAAHLPFDVTMVRQNVEVMIAEGFALIDSPTADRSALVVVPTSFGKMGELDGAAEDWNEESDAALQENDADTNMPPP
jgi:LacI family transcriptional regulator, fructose operon transcriptional repressor